jgi:phosphoesterase RecJ-like protein
MQKITKDNINIIRDLVKAKERIVITSHHNPDGDAIGSILGLFHMLKSMGIAATMIIPNDIPDFLTWLPESKKVVRYSKSKEAAIELIKTAEVIFSLDYNASSRLEGMKNCFDQSDAVKILIDHHPFPEEAFQWALSETQASSTAELIYEFAVLLNAEEHINFDAASSIYAGIMTDTGSFSYACSYPRTFEIVAKLISKGVKVETAQQQVYNNFSESRMRLLGYSLESKMKVFPEFRSAYIALTHEELKRFKYRIGDTEGLVNYPLSIKNIIFSALFVENKDFVKVSLRSVGSFPANKICEEHFNGGGHTNAAGGKSFATMGETETKFTEILKQYEKELNA